MRYLNVLFIVSLLAGCAANDASTTVKESSATTNTQEVNSTASQSENINAEPQAAETKETAERLICHTENVTGSNRKVRTCRKVSSS